MGKLVLAIVTCFMVLLVPMVNCASIETDQWLHEVANVKEKVTRLHFYLHDTFGGPNPTAIRVAQANSTDKSPTLFGGVVVIDDPLTTGPELTSKNVGRAQGLYASADQKNMSLLISMNILLTSGKFNGSTLAIFGRDATEESPRELPIIGGTGAFRLARGLAVLKDYNASDIGAIVHYDLTVLHY